MVGATAVDVRRLVIERSRIPARGHRVQPPAVGAHGRVDQPEYPAELRRIEPTAAFLSLALRVDVACPS
jgi:hypothetical protein